MGSYDERAPEDLMERGAVEAEDDPTDLGVLLLLLLVELLRSGVLLNAETGELIALELLLDPGEGISELASC